MFGTFLLHLRILAESSLSNTTLRLQEETARVEQYLLSSHSNFTSAIITAYTSSGPSRSTFENMLEPLQKIVRLSPPIAGSLAVPEIFSRTEQKLNHKDAVTRLNLLRILRTICDAKEEGCWLIRAFGCYERITWLMEQDPAVLVRQMAEELVHASDEVEVNGLGITSSGKRSLSRASNMGMNLRRPPSSAGRRDGSGSSSGSTLASAGLGLTPPTPTSLKSNNFLVPPMSTPGSCRDRVTRAQSASSMWDLMEDPNTTPQSSRSNKAPVLARSSTSFAALASPTATPRPSTARPASRDANHSSLLHLQASSRSGAPERSRLPKARAQHAAGRLGEAINKRRQSNFNLENDHPGHGVPPGTPPLPRLQIVRRRRDTSGGEFNSANGVRRGSTAD